MEPITARTIASLRRDIPSLFASLDTVREADTVLRELGAHRLNNKSSREAFILKEEIRENWRQLFTPEAACLLFMLMMENGTKVDLFVTLEDCPTTPEEGAHFMWTLAEAIKLAPPLTASDRDSGPLYINQVCTTIEHLMGFTEGSTHASPLRVTQLMFESIVDDRKAVTTYATIEHLMQQVKSMFYYIPSMQTNGGPTVTILHMSKAALDGYSVYMAQTNPQWEKIAGFLTEAGATVEEHADQLAELCLLLRDEILQSPRRDVRPEGLDSFGYGWISDWSPTRGRFFREGFDFPAVGVAWQYTLANGAVYERISWYDPAKIPESGAVLAKLPPSLLFRDAATLIALHHFMSAPVPGRSESEGKSDHPPREGKRVPIRQTTRDLPRGHVASEKAREAFRTKYGKELPDGKTFVKAHEGLRGTVAGPRSEQGDTKPDRPEIFVDLGALLSWLH